MSGIGTGREPEETKNKINNGKQKKQQNKGKNREGRHKGREPFLKTYILWELMPCRLVPTFRRNLLHPSYDIPA